ncbi:hypothetical protein [Amycolatopsis sp. NBRC 101858]|uniref:hypothetical protein n=1 Tax=Amycolatopsis sp. NBRC 101858 TaxID=3032200 RepID=UPI002555F901|nr:hypothetical protein [Amycolatopsis sp. NBRC 101858]
MGWGWRVTALAVVVGCVVWVEAGTSLSHDDYRAAVDSAAARANREINDRWAAKPLTDLPPQLPWAEWAEPRTREVCEVDYATEFGARNPGTITCRMTYSRTAGFDGDFLTRIGEADAAGRALGWLEGGSVLRSSVEYYRITEAQAGKVDAGTVPAVSYLVPAPAPGTTGCTSPGYIGESWVERSNELSGRFGEWPSAGALFERSSGPLPQATATDLLSRHRYVMAFTLGTECRLKVG